MSHIWTPWLGLAEGHLVVCGWCFLQNVFSKAGKGAAEDAGCGGKFPVGSEGARLPLN